MGEVGSKEGLVVEALVRAGMGGGRPWGCFQEFLWVNQVRRVTLHTLGLADSGASSLEHKAGFLEMRNLYFC